MKSKLPIVILLIIVIASTLALPASATGYISGFVKYNDGSLAGGVSVTATNISNALQNVTVLSRSDVGNVGSYVINIPDTFLNGTFSVTATKIDYIGSSEIVDVNVSITAVPRDLILTKILYPGFKTDEPQAPQMPADRGVSFVDIKATIKDSDGNLLAFGDTHNTTLSNTIANVSFYLIDGGLNVSNGNNGSLEAITGTQIGSAVINVPILEDGTATVRVRSGNNRGTVKLFNNVSINKRDGKELNTTIVITFTPLSGEITGTARDSNNNLVSGATITAKRFYIYQNFTSGANYSYGWEDITLDAFENPLIASTNGVGDYVLDRVPIKYNEINTTTQKGYQYEFYNNSLAPGNFTPPNGSTFINYIMVTGNKSGLDIGIVKTFLEVGTTATGNDIVLPTVPTIVTGIEVRADNTTPKQLDPLSIKPFPTSWQITAKLLTNTGAPVVNRNITFTINNINVSKFLDGSNTAYALTQADGIARITVYSNVTKGIANVTGSYLAYVPDWDQIKSVGIGQISGDISDENHLVLPSVSVTLLWNNGTAYITALKSDGTAFQPVLTGADGHYTFVEVPSGNYKVVGDLTTTAGPKSGFTLTTVPDDGGTVTADIVITLSGALQTGNIVGRVTNASNAQGIDGANVFLDAETTARAITNATGYYSIPNIAVGSHTVKAVKTSYSTNTVTVNVVAGLDVNANIALTPSAGSVVQQYDTNGTPGIQKDEAINALNDYLFNGTLSKDGAIAVLNAYLFG